MKGMDIHRKRQAIVREAKSWIGTPWQHQGRVKQNEKFKGGVDCLGLIIEVGNAFQFLGENRFDYKNYNRSPRDDDLLNEFDKHTIKVPVPEALPGDIVVMRIAKDPQHAAIMTFDHSVIHACAKTGFVVETRLSPRLWDLVRAAYRYPGV